MLLEVKKVTPSTAILAVEGQTEGLAKVTGHVGKAVERDYSRRVRLVN